MARVLEEHGIASVCMMSRSDLAEMVKAPRTLIGRYPYGAPLGEPGNAPMQLGVLREVLSLLVSANKSGAIVESEFRWRAS